MYNTPVYVDYTSDYVFEAMNKFGFEKLTVAALNIQGVPVTEITEKTASEAVNASLITHLTTKKYLEQSLSKLGSVLRNK